MLSLLLIQLRLPWQIINRCNGAPLELIRWTYRLEVRIFLIFVEMRHGEEVDHIHEAQHSHEPVEEVELLAVEGEAVREPPGPRFGAGDLVDDVHNDGADEVTQGDCAE